MSLLQRKMADTRRVASRASVASGPAQTPRAHRHRSGVMTAAKWLCSLLGTAESVTGLHWSRARRSSAKSFATPPMHCEAK